MTDLSPKLKSIETLLKDNAALLELALKEALDYVEEYGNAPNTRIHFVGFYALVVGIVLFLLGLMYPLSMYDISRTNWGGMVFQRLKSSKL